MIDLQTLEERRALLVEQMNQDKAQYERLEQLLADLRRSLDMQHGALREVEGLLALVEAPAPRDVEGLAACDLCIWRRCEDCRNAQHTNGRPA